MPSVTLSDSTVLNFPEGMSQAEMKAAIDKFVANRDGKGFEVGPSPSLAEAALSGQPQLRQHDPSLLDDAAVGLNSIGLPGDRVRSGVQSLKAFGNSALDGVTAGLANKATAGIHSLFGGDFDQRLAQERGEDAFNEFQHPVASALGDVGGTVLGFGKISKTGGAAVKGAAKLGAAAAKPLSRQAATGIKLAERRARRSLAGRATGDAVTGAIMGGSRAFGSDEDISKGVATGAIAGAGGRVVGEKLGGVANKVIGSQPVQALAKKTGIPVGPPNPLKQTVETLKVTSKALFDKAEKQGVIFTPQAIKDIRKASKLDLAKLGFHQKNQPGAAVALKELERMKGTNVTLEGLNAARELVAGGWRAGNDKNNKMISVIIRHIDEMVENAGPKQVLTGNAAKAKEILNEARDLWSRQRKLKTFEDLVEKGALNEELGGAANSMQRQLKSLITGRGKTRGFTGAEIRAIRDAVKPGFGLRRGLGAVGNLSPAAGLKQAIVGGAGVMTAPQFAIPAIIAGIAAKKGSEALGRRAVKNTGDLIASGGRIPQPNTLQKMLARYLSAQGVTQQD